MLLKLFKSNKPSVIFLIPVLAALLWLPVLFNTPAQISVAKLTHTTFIFNWLLQLFNFYPKASTWFALFLVIIEAYMIIGLNVKFIFIENKTYLPSLFFVLFASLFSAYQQLHPLLVGNFFVLLLIDRIFLFDKSTIQMKRFYEGGFLLGLASLIYPNIYLFIVLIWVTQITLRTFNWREMLSSILGLLTPFAFYLSILFVSNKFNKVVPEILSMIFSPIDTLHFSFLSKVALGFLSFVIALAVVVGLQKVSAGKISTRKYFNLFFIFAILIIALFFVHPSFGLELVVPLAIPLSIIGSVFFMNIKRKWVGEVLFTLTVLSVFVIIWFQ